MRSPSRFAILLGVTSLLGAPAAFGQSRPAPGDHPGAWFISSPQGGGTLRLDVGEGRRLIIAFENLPGNFIRSTPDGKTVLHTGGHDAEMHLCLPGDPDPCFDSSYYYEAPWGPGRVRLNAVIALGSQLTVCPFVVSVTGRLTDPDTGEEYRLTYHRIVFGEINGTICRTIRDELKLTPFEP